MQLPDVILGLLQRFTPADAHSMAGLKVEFLNQYNSIKHSMETKTAKNQKKIEELDKLENELDSIDPHTPEHSEKLLQFERLSQELDNPTLIEKGVAFFEKPLVRVVLMALFAIASWWITKKLTSKKEEPEEPENEPDFPRHQGGYYPPHQPPYYPPSYWPQHTYHGQSHK